MAVPAAPSIVVIIASADNSGRPTDLNQLRSGIPAQAYYQPLVTGRKVTDGLVDGEILC